MTDEERTGYGHYEPDDPAEDPEEVPRKESAASEPKLNGPPCDICAHPMLDKHCKLICLNCGFRRDCSDP